MKKNNTFQKFVILTGICMISISFVLQAQTSPPPCPPCYMNIIVNVEDQEGHPLSGAEVQISGESYFTDDQGYVEFSILTWEPDEINCSHTSSYLVVKAPGFSESTRRIDIGCGSANYTITLLPWQTTDTGYRFGDVNEDWLVNIIDALLIVHYLIEGELAIQLTIIEAADVNNDGVINVLDALLIAQFVVGIVTQLPV